MKKIVIIIIAYALLVGNVLASKPLHPLSVNMEPTQLPVLSGNIQVKLELSSRIDVEDLDITVNNVDNLIYHGSEGWQISLLNKDTTKIYFEVEIPDNDTSGITLRLGMFCESAIYFVTTGEETEIWAGNPKYHTEFPPQTHVGVGRRGRVIPGEFPLMDSLYGYGDKLYRDTTARKEPEIITIKLTKTEILNYQKQEAEKYVLTEKQQESFYIDGQMWQRLKGEQFFRKIEGITNTSAYTRHIADSIAALPGDHEYEVCLYLNKPEQKELVKQIVGELPEEESNEFYHVVIQKKDKPQLRNVGIIIADRTKVRCEHDPQKFDSTSKKNRKN